MYWLWVALLAFGLVAAWVVTVLSLPGNWIMVAFVGVFAWFFPVGVADSPGVHWSLVIVLLGIAGVGELIEFIASAAGVAQTKGGRRTMVLAVVGALAGSLVGAVIGVPIPIIGPIIAAVGGGALGAFGGAYVSETLAGKSAGEAAKISTGALVGRLLGTGAKVFLGILMIVITGLFVIFGAIPS